MTIQRYEIFNKVVQLGNITKAGEELNITQSGISHAIKSLEDELGLHLLKRGRTGIKLTREGEKIYEHTLDILRANNNLLQQASTLNGLETGVIKIGTFASVTAHWLPRILNDFELEYPKIEVKIFEDDYTMLEKALLSGELDCCFTTTPNQKKIEFIPLKKDKLFCIVSNDSPLKHQKKIKTEQLQQYPLIKPKKGWDNEIASFLDQQNIIPNVKYEISDDQAIIALVQANLGINIRPELVLKNTPNNITAIEFENDAYRIIGLATTNQKSQATKRFISTVTELFPPI